jgi:hypothetical protein
MTSIPDSSEPPRRAPRAHPGGLARALGALDRDGVAITLVVLLALLAFSPWWAGGRVFAPLDLLDGLYAPFAGPEAMGEFYNHFTSDAVTQYLVHNAFAERSFAEDGYIGWREASGAGRAEEGNTMGGYADWTMQLHRVLDFWTAWHLGLLGQFLIAALGMYAFLRGQRLIPLVALLGAIAFGANTQFVAPIYHRWHLAGFAWIPWLAWSMFAWRDGRRWAWLLAPAFLALSVLGGNLQTNVFTALVVVSLWAGWLWEGQIRQDGQIRWDGRAWLVPTGHVAAWSLLGLGLASFALVPETVAMLETLSVGMGRSGIGYAQGPLQPLASLLLIPLQAFPTLLGSPRSLDLAKPLGADLFGIAYFGFLPVLLALRTPFLRGAPAAMKLLILVGLLLPLTPLVGPLYHRAQLVFVFGGVWAAGWYWQHADRTRVDPVLRVLFLAFGAGVGLWLLVSVVGAMFQERLVSRLQAMVMGAVAPAQLEAYPFYAEWMADRAARFVRESWIWHPRQVLAVATALAGFGAVVWRLRAGVAPAAAVLCAVVAVELGASAVAWVTVAEHESETLYPVPAELALVRQRVGDGRVHIVHGLPSSFLPPNTHELAGLSAIQFYETITPPGLWRVAYDDPTAADLAAVAVTHAVTRPAATPGDGWELEYRGERLALWRNPGALPRYQIVGGARDPAAPPGAVAASPVAASPVAARVVAATQNRRLLELPPAARGVRVRENWAPGWRYRVAGGDWAAPAREPDGGMVLAVDPSDMAVTVELRYRPHRYGGGWITLAALLVWGAAAVLVVATGHGPRLPRRELAA